MTDSAAQLSGYVRNDTANPPGDCREAAELPCRTLRQSGLSPVTFGARTEKPGGSPMGPLYFEVLVRDGRNGKGRPTG